MNWSVGCELNRKDADTIIVSVSIQTVSKITGDICLSDLFLDNMIENTEVQKSLKDNIKKSFQTLILKDKGQRVPMETIFLLDSASEMILNLIISQYEALKRYENAQHQAE